MGKKQTVLFPKTQSILATMGEQIKLARLRRKLSSELVSERAGISRATLWQIEQGSPSVTMGSYAAVLNSLGLQDDLLLIAKDDILGRTFQDLNLPIRKRAEKK
ncbi:MAG: helix-turn-helix transcriptional regulator [Candidatus Treponema excrementipullorum]|nr:helix-turn-helix domain-containing protein [Spirochaetia bacterium]MDD7012806.1 helix-turn-helix transcriptional regulator [Candidatus Treponema excrementipullorum]MDY4466377.1 helix-turn-helix transcriptional regulator [Candidatus Treponema excrementipullorum]MDY4708002.1 helix-turn-helix transcriptional regulator [Candidatus Treponema excrementipullorum]